jgi:hypothetical protein
MPNVAEYAPFFPKNKTKRFDIINSDADPIGQNEFSSADAHHFKPETQKKCPPMEVMTTA